MTTTQPSTALIPVSVSDPVDAALRQAVAAHLARYTGQTRTHTESDLRAFLTWCNPTGPVPVDSPPGARRAVRAVDAGDPPL